MAIDADSWAALVLSLLEAVAGTVTSSFIVFHVLRNILKGQTPSSRDKILLALSVSNMASPVVLSTTIVSEVFSFHFSAFMNVFSYSLVLYCMSSSSWLTLCLCFFYFIKIMGFGSGYLSMMKKNIDKLVPWSILVVELVSLCGGLLNAMLDMRLKDSLLNTFTSANTMHNNLSAEGFYDVMYVATCVSYPLIIVTTSCIMASVTIHIHRMRSHISGSISLEAHHRVVKTMRYLVAFYVLFYLLLLIDYWAEPMLPNPWSSCTYLILLLTLSPVQSLIIIHGNTRLKDSWKQMWRRLGRRALFT